MSTYFYFGKKTPRFYKGLRIKADLGLHNEIAKEIRSKLPNGGRILDFGAGEGALSERLTDLGYEVLSVDINKKDFGAKNAEFHQLNFNDKDSVKHFVVKHESSFDAVLGIEVIEHIEDQWNFVRQLLKMVKRGGILLITTPNITSWLSRLIFLLTGRFHQFLDSDITYGHINPICSWRLALILNQCGVDKVTIKPAGTLPPIYFGGNNFINRFILGLISLINLPIYFFMRGIKKGWCILAIGEKL